MNKIKGMYLSKTDIGKVRKSNEDKSIALVNSSGDVLLLVADGMGGHNKGSFASTKVVQVVPDVSLALYPLIFIAPALHSWLKLWVQFVASQFKLLLCILIPPSKIYFLLSPEIEIKCLYIYR